MSFTSSNVFVDNIWSKISNRTWLASEPVMGSQIVFLTNKFGEKKAIFQLHGSGCYVIKTEIYNVEINGNFIILTSAEKLLIDTASNLSLGYYYSEIDDRLTGIASNINYHVDSEEPIIYKLCNKKVNVDSLRNDTITFRNFK